MLRRVVSSWHAIMTRHDVTLWLVSWSRCLISTRATAAKVWWYLLSLLKYGITSYLALSIWERDLVVVGPACLQIPGFRQANSLLSGPLAAVLLNTNKKYDWSRSKQLFVYDQRFNVQHTLTLRAQMNCNFIWKRENAMRSWTNDWGYWFFQTSKRLMLSIMLSLYGFTRKIVLRCLWFFVVNRSSYISCPDIMYQDSLTHSRAVVSNFSIKSAICFRPVSPIRHALYIRSFASRTLFVDGGGR